MTFKDRADAGQQLAAAMQHLRGRNDLLVLGIPRGGVSVAAEIAYALRAPLDICLAHKIGAPENPEFAIGAIAEGGEPDFDANVIRALRIEREYIEREVANQRREIERRAREYRNGYPCSVVKDKTVLLVDDGLATGATALAAARTLKQRDPAKLILAVPVAPPETIARLATVVDDTLALLKPSLFHAVGEFYENFGEVSDQEVTRWLRKEQRPV